MPLTKAQKKTIHQVIQPAIVNIIDALPDPKDKNSLLLVRGLIRFVLSPDSAHEAISWNANIPGYSFRELGKFIARLPESARDALKQLQNHYFGVIHVLKHDPVSVKTSGIGEVRAEILRAALKVMHEKYPQETFFPKLPPIADEITGMERIRALFRQYLTLTRGQSLERSLLALEILQEKAALGHESFISPDYNMLETTAWGPGDFSNLDLSKMTFNRSLALCEPVDEFKGLHFKGSNLNGSTFSGVAMSGSKFDECSLRGVDLGHLCNMYDSTWVNADVEGLLVRPNYFYFPGAKNEELIRNEATRTGFLTTTPEQLLAFRRKDKLISVVSVFWSQPSSDPAVNDLRAQATQVTNDAMVRDAAFRASFKK